MHFIKNPLRLIFLVLLLTPVMSFGQFFDRFEIGYNYVSATGTYTGVSTVIDGNGNFAGDTTGKRTITATGFGIDLGTTFPLKRLGHTKMLGLTIHLIVNEFVWGNLNQVYTLNGDFVNANNNMDGLTEQIAMPIGLDYKMGTDAILTKRLHFGASFGLGIYPSLNATVMVDPANLNGGGGLGFGINPYAKAEVALFGGICFKFRAMFSYGNVPYIDQNKSLVSLTDGPFKITGTSNLMLSFIIMPFGWHWRETGWYNTYDTYNPYEKG
jgi:hypothetical protein